MFSSTHLSDSEAGQKLEDDFEYNNCVSGANAYIRKAFLRKVYTIVSVQLLLTTVVTGIMMYFKGPIALFASSYPSILLWFLCASIGLLIGMHIKRHESPINLILFMSFTVVESAAIGFTVVHFDVFTVLNALMITTVVVIALTLYTLQSKHDYSSWGACLGTCLLALCVGGFANLVMGSQLMEFGLAIGGAILFSLLLIFDTHLIMHRFSAEEYVPAALTLYLDVINLFLHILRILQAAKQ